MYSFTDTTALPGSNDLPAEAMSINGQYIENLIPGYRTLTVSGRESIEAELSTLEASCRDGNVYQRRRYLPRTLVVQYQLIAQTAEVFAALHTQLLSILSAEQAQIIFADEPDKYYVGTKTRIENVPPGLLAVRGEITIYCADPFKYSVEETEVTPVDGEFSVDYTGTYPSRPRFVATMGTEAGYVGYIDGDGHVLQIGDPDEADGYDIAASELLVDVKFSKSGSMSGWTANNGVLSDTNSFAMDEEGSFSIGTVGGIQGIVPSCTQTSPDVRWHGPSLTKTIPANSEGVVGAVNCKMRWRQFFTMTNSKGTDQLGLQQVVMSDALGRAVFAVDIRKNKQGTNKAKVQFYKLGKLMRSAEFPCGFNNTVTGAASPTGGYAGIEKLGGQFRVVFAGKTYYYTDDSLADTAITKATIYCAASGLYPQMNHVIREFQFYFHNTDTYREIKNKLAAGDVIEADCFDGTISVNGAETPALGALGNDWEGFVLKPGTNQIRCLASDWVQTAPEFKMYYRKVYL